MSLTTEGASSATPESRGIFPEKVTPHEHNSEDEFDKILDAAKSNSSPDDQPGAVSTISSDAQLVDNYEPEDQKERYRAITLILHHYEESYNSKILFQRVYRKLLFWICVVIILVFSALVLYTLTFSVKNAQKIDLSGAAVLVTAVLSLAVSILKLIEIITKYCFPENDDEYVVKIVESIQVNDLEKYKESNRAKEARGEKKVH